MQLRKKKSLIDQAIDQASEVVDAALPVIESAMTQMREQVREIGNSAADGAKDLAKDTAARTAPLVAEGKNLAAEIAEATRDVAIPKAKASALAGADKAAGLAVTASGLAAAKVAEAREGPEKKKRGSRLRKVLIFGGLVALAGFVARRFRPEPQTDNWQSAYTPPTSTTSATSGGTHLAPGVGPDEPVGVDDPMVERAGDDPGGASPDEAMADAVEEPHPVTTPDDPADVVDVEPEPSEKKG